MRLDLEKSSFAFGENGSYDALNVCVIISQILVASQNDGK